MRATAGVVTVVPVAVGDAYRSAKMTVFEVPSVSVL